jgi:hypothetical protein
MYAYIVGFLSQPKPVTEPTLVRATSRVHTGLQQVQLKFEYHCPPWYSPYTPPKWPTNLPAPASMPVPPPGMSFPVRTLDSSIPPNYIMVLFKTRTLMPGEQARPS